MATQPKTMIYTVDLGDGRVVDIEGPEGATPEQLQAVVAGQSPTAGGGQSMDVYTTPVGTTDIPAGQSGDPYGAPEGQETSLLEDAKAGFGMGTRSIMGGVGGLADIATLPVSTLLRLLGVDVGSYRDLADQGADALGLAKPQTNAQKIIGELGGGATAGAGLGGIAALARGAPGVAGAVMEAMAATPAADAVAGAAGSASAEMARQAGGGPLAQFAASLAGGGLGAAASAAPRAIANTLPRNRALSPYAQAAQDLGIDILPADAGGPTVRRLTSAAAQAPLSAAPVINAGQRMVQQAQAATQKIARGFAEPGTMEAGGEAARRGALEYIKSSGKQGGRFYDKANELAGDARMPLPKAMQAIDEQIARLKETPGGADTLSDLEDLRSALNREDGFSVQGIRDMRTEMFVAPELRGSPSERRLKQIVEAASQDIEDGLKAQGRGDAAAAFRAADDYWKTRLDTIDNFIRPIIGKDATTKGGEDIYKTINAAATGNTQRLGRFMSALPEEDANLVRATLINRLGLARKGSQNAEGDAFSLETFLSNWNDLTPRAKDILFGSEAKDALQKLALVAEKSREASTYANRSNTAGGIWGNLGVLGGVSAASPTAAGLGAASQIIGGKLLASPRFARWLAAAPKKPNPAAERAHIGRLAAIGAAEPTIQNEVFRLQDRLMKAFAESPQGIAAEEDQK